MGWVVFSAVADEATHCYPHCLFVKCHSTLCTLGVIAVGGVALHVVHPGWRMGGIGLGRPLLIHYMRKLFERCHGLINHFDLWRMGGISAVADEAAHDPRCLVGNCWVTRVTPRRKSH